MGGVFRCLIFRVGDSTEGGGGGVFPCLVSRVGDSAEVGGGGNEGGVFRCLVSGLLFLFRLGW